MTDDYEEINRRWLDSIEILRQTCERADREFARECERYREWRIRARQGDRSIDCPECGRFTGHRLDCTKEGSHD